MLPPRNLQHFNQQLIPRLQQIFKGIRRDQAATHPPKVRLPITLLTDHTRYQTIVVWEAAVLYQRHDMDDMLSCLFFGFLRVSEFTVPSQEQYDQSCHLSLRDMSVDNRDNPHLLRIHIKQSKTDPFRRGVEIYLGATDDSVCPVRHIWP